MIVKYNPKRTPEYGLITGVDAAFAELVPDGYNPNKKWLLGIWVHGIGERSGGTLDNLKNLVEGFDYNGDGIREGAPFVTPEMKKAVDQYGIIMLVPTYETDNKTPESDDFFEPDKVNVLYNYAVNKYNVYPKMILTGFSLGGGAGIKYATSSEANANRVGCLVLCAPTNNIIDKTIPGKVKMPVHSFHNDKDDRVNVGNTKTIIAALNETATLKAQYTIFRQDYHGSNTEAWGLNPPAAPGGQGVINLSENIYQWGTDCIINGPRQMRSGTAVIQPPPVIEAPPTVTPVTSYTIDEKGIHLVGDKSIGYKTGSDGRWELVSAPEGVTKAQVFPGGSTYINADGKLPVPGVYVFQFFLKGAIKPVDVTVQHGEAVKTFSGFNSTTDLITYSDGTTEKGEATFLQGKWTVKTAGGKVIL